MTGVGHNGGPGLGDSGWHRYAWQRARAELMPTLPLEVIRMRVNRARDLGLEYKSYASIRAVSGRDVIAFLFSSNALRVGPKVVTMPEDRASRLGLLRGVQRLGAVHLPLGPTQVIAANKDVLEAAAQAPTLADGWGQTRERLIALTRSRGIPSDAVVIVGDTALEAEWAVAGRMAAYLPSEAFFRSL